MRALFNGQVAQSVEQRTENPRVGGSIPPLATIRIYLSSFLFIFFSYDEEFSKGLIFMSRTCQVTGKKPQVGNKVSHANNKTKRRFLPNIQEHRFWLESEKRFIKLKVSAHGMRVIDKRGVDAVVAELRERGEI